MSEYWLACERSGSVSLITAEELSWVSGMMSASAGFTVLVVVGCCGESGARIGIVSVATEVVLIMPAAAAISVRASSSSNRMGLLTMLRMAGTLLSVAAGALSVLFSLLVEA